MENIKNLLTKGLSNQKKLLIIFFLTLIILSRVTSILIIKPANAPDETGHLYIVNNLAHGNFVSVEDELKSSGYPYSLYNPLPYLPSVVLLKVASIFDSEVLSLKKANPNIYQEYNNKNVWLARAGQMVWTLLFFLVLWKFLEQLLALLGSSEQKKTDKLIFLPFLFVISLPQLLFIQSYVNLDNMGMFAAFYHFWAILVASPVHFAISLFLLLNSKLNFICIFAITCLYLLYLYKQRKLSSQWIKSISISLFLSLWWSVALTTFQRMGTKSILGFSLLAELYKDMLIILPKPSMLHFIQMTFLSSYGVFGWMNQYMPVAYYLFFAIMLALGGFTFIYYLNTKKNIQMLFLGFLAVIISNICLHFLSGIFSAYQPQGRYLLVSIVIIYICGLIYISTKLTQLKKMRALIYSLIVAFSISEIAVAIHKAAEDPFLMAYGNSNFLIKQDFSHEKMRELLTGDEVTQSFDLAAPISRIYLRFTSFYRANDNLSNMSLSDCHGKTFISQQLTFDNLSGPADIKVLDFTKPTRLDSNSLCVHLKVLKGETGKSISLLKSFEHSSHIGKLSLNGEPLGGDLVIKVF